MQRYKIIRIRIIQLRIIYSFLIVSLVDSQKAVQYELPLQKPPPILETSYIGGRKYMGVAASQNGPIDLSSLLEPKASPDQKRRNQLKSNILMPRNLYTYHPKPLYLWQKNEYLFPKLCSDRLASLPTSLPMSSLQMKKPCLATGPSRVLLKHPCEIIRKISYNGWLFGNNCLTLRPKKQIHQHDINGIFI